MFIFYFHGLNEATILLGSYYHQNHLLTRTYAIMSKWVLLGIHEDTHFNLEEKLTTLKCWFH